MAKKSGLGMGLGALFADNATEDKVSSINLPINDIEPNRNQPRKSFDDGALAELADSIAAHGVLQPLIVRPINEGGGYQIVAGERRWRAAKMAGLHEIPAIIRELSDQDVSELALIENLQREDLNPLEEALGYQNLINSYNMTQEQVSKSVGRSRSAVANALRLLSLDEEIQGELQKGTLTAGHARALLSIKDEKKRKEAAKLTIDKELSVRELEKLAKKLAQDEEKAENTQKTAHRSVFVDEVEISLTEHLGRKVTVNDKKGKGTLVIEYYSEEDLKEIANLLDNK
ncbi:MAG: ParB/RepB/Spo0J family partition protein [Clostridia bacterium]|nr:ParB/RepB/Spo0J family partition protein [Clostridia bacterium]